MGHGTDDHASVVRHRPDYVPSPHTLVLGLEVAESREEVLAALSRLPSQQAEAVLMRLANEQSYAEIAQALGCSESSVRTHVERGRARLRKILNHFNPSRGPR